MLHLPLTTAKEVLTVRGERIPSSIYKTSNRNLLRSDLFITISNLLLATSYVSVKIILSTTTSAIPKAS